MSKNSSKTQLTSKYKQALEETTKAKRAKEIIVYLNLLIEEAKKIKKGKDFSQDIKKRS